MATEKQVLQDSGAAAADYSAKQFFGVYHSAAETLTLNATVGGWNAGPLQDDPESGEFGTVQLLGLSKMEISGTVAVGDPLCVTAAGSYIKALNSTDYVTARALQAGTTGEVITGFVSHEGYNSAFGDFTVDGRGGLHVLRCTFDPSTNASERTVAAHAVAETLPDNAVVVRGYLDVLTTFTDGASDTATISIGIPTDDAAGIVAAVAINDGGNPWDAGWHECIQDGTAAAFANTCTAERAITFTVGTAALTAGKLVLFLEYVIID